MGSGVEAALEAAAALIRASRHTVALTGAGLSAESGIPTYRGNGGLWTRFGEPTIDGWELFQADPAAWWAAALDPDQRRTEFAQAITSAEPNAGHLAIAAMEERGWLGHVITQNIDDLHRRAGTRNLTEIHGNRFLARCMACGGRMPLDAVDLGTLPPTCPECGGTLKNDTVMFGEPIPDDALRACYREAGRAEAFIVAGTSAVVYPAASFPLMAARRGVPLIEVNPEVTELSAVARVTVRAPAGEAFPRLLDLLAAGT